MGLDQVLGVISSGVYVGDLLLKADVTKGRFPEERNLRIFICRQEQCSQLAKAKVFLGRLPYYRPWVEIFSVNPAILRTPLMECVEDVLLHIISEGLGPGERFFIEYLWDRETMKQLEEGFPPQITRLGFKLYRLGYTWFKDWYYPEGFMEGGPKLQAEKPVTEEQRLSNINEMLREAVEVLKKFSSLRVNELTPYELRALARAQVVAKELSSLVNEIDEPAEP